LHQRLAFIKPGFGVVRVDFYRFIENFNRLRPASPGPLAQYLLLFIASVNLESSLIAAS